MVCQKTPESAIDFEKDGLEVYVDGDFIKARGTTLGADNGIAVAMVLAILESDTIAHPPIEAVFTTDEEIGMIGARALDTNVLKGNRMINLDSETDGVVTVSCAGGSDFVANIPIDTVTTNGTLLTLEIHGLKGGHSGIEINKNRVNANIIAGRILSEIKPSCEYDIISINGGDKPNAIPNRCVIKLCTSNPNALSSAINNLSQIIKNEISDREPNFNVVTTIDGDGVFATLTNEIKEKIIYILLCAPNGVTEMSATVDGLVETSLNLGILATKQSEIDMHFALRSNKMSSLEFLEKRLCAFFDMINVSYNTFGHYPAWEYRENSPLRNVFCDTYKQTFGKDAVVEAIHAGLECGVFAGNILDFDCISIGPNMHDVHTINERLSISSTENLFKLIIKILEILK